VVMTNRKLNCPAEFGNGRREFRASSGMALH
jgi:hypothetical protein